jgi:hypothetical protein
MKLGKVKFSGLQEVSGSEKAVECLLVSKRRMVGSVVRAKCVEMAASVIFGHMVT